MKLKNLILLTLIFSVQLSFSQGFVIDHNCTDLSSIPESAVNNAKSTLHIAYGHTSHGSQLITGMNGLMAQSTDLHGYIGDIYIWNEGGNDGAMDIDDYFGSGDLGHNGDTTWAPPTRTYLANNPDVNVIMYSWCGGCSDNTYEGIQIYLDKMNELEEDYPNVTFVYMTGHVDIYADATLKTNNQQIRNYCIVNNKILYDFADIERYDPDGTYYEFVHDDCNYYDDVERTNLLGNWATDWQATHIEGVDWYSCSASHSQALNGNRKAYAAWWLFGMIAGWEGTADSNLLSRDVPDIYPNPVSSNLTIDLKNNRKFISSVDLYDIWGRHVKHFDGSSIENADNKLDFNIGNLQDGTYLIKIHTNKGTVAKKIFVIR